MNTIRYIYKLRNKKGKVIETFRHIAVAESFRKKYKKDYFEDLDIEREIKILKFKEMKGGKKKDGRTRNLELGNRRKRINISKTCKSEDCRSKSKKCRRKRK